MKLRQVMYIFTAAILTLSSISANAQSSLDSESMLDGIDAQSVYVCEIETGTAICEQNSSEERQMGHMAKLMTVLICAEELEKGVISLDDIVTASANANSKQGTQIWLDVGEKITVEELLKSIIISNANDACTALAEYLSGSEEAYVTRLNKRAQRLGMENTVFADCCGMDENTVSTAKDIAILSCEIAKHDCLTEYFTTWIDHVRCNAVELVNNNRLVRSYKGMIGTKACASEGAGECISVSAKRGDLGICVVLLGCSDNESKMKSASNLLDICFDNFSYFSPEIDREFLVPIKVSGGQKLEVCVKENNFSPTIIRSDINAAIEYSANIQESVKAPVKKGDVLGEITYSYNNETLVTVQICAAEDVPKMTFSYALKCCLYNLLKI
ncbi:MAG: D-alanyl-D-alanine carboxypeptidase [Ruminococcus sp.]|nr:D-alanyl-D-alanine carboxypeptidase [Ruminococcus sp.]